MATASDIVRNHQRLLSDALDNVTFALQNYNSRDAFIGLRNAAFYRGVILANIPKLVMKSRLSIETQAFQKEILEVQMERVASLTRQFVNSSLRF